MFLHDQFAPAAQVGEPLPPESSQAETVVLPEEEAPSLPKEEAPAPEELPPEAEEPAEPTAPAVARDGSYSSMQEVADYIHTYGKLPQNYITKNKARDLGWESSQGNLWDVAPGMSIGGDRFGNYEGLLPEANGRTWTECDIDYEGGHRNAKRIVFSNDGLIFYTDNHYESFTQLY
ncbi:MAG: ribonuclease [Oscillospiraceae bacterium]|nr:ribonuclease [Oscillospiraceae bacterium]